ncbi:MULTISPECIES: ABC transporter permease [unclassified Janthinobacterium]|uniref:ABC transporter permease n=1 Tax=unclassified Janthinobacterium TaxID=2610881 RepID=UPI001620D967|nr:MULTISPECIES: FtsX-like permease family protein [unclassified Janthinobacterium]MBB5367540.1 putative ABC transport system permease protein [Janthinobacterium sp. K2C7]MBB5379982.1 putative ABC transport system permease protein [Janthinobacterium sp. K2Li3]MBB5385922.1 putative ABC transport system permease protein [Janthinobacterium sp. K2E3]
MFRLSLNMTARDWRAGQLRFLLVALIVAVAALSAVGFFVDRLRSGLNRDAHQLLGADLVISADQPVNAAWRAEAQKRGFTLADTVTFPSMAQAGEGEQSQSQLASIKAVSPGYPLRGQLKITTDVAQAADAVGQPANRAPAPGTVWVDAGILSSLNAKLGDNLKLGDKNFTVTQLIAAEPDRGASFLNFAPRVMLPLGDLAATALVQDGSRVSYRLLLSAPQNKATDIAAYQSWLEGQIKQQAIKGVRIESLESGSPQMQSTLDRADRFLSLVGLLSAMLAAVAVAMAARRFMLRHLDACAMLRCLGLTQNQVTAMYVIEFVMVGLAGSLVGVAVGYAGHMVLLELLGKLVQNDLPPVSIMPALQGVATGMLLLLGFALPPILQLRNVPHNRVIRREQEAPQPLALATYGLGIAAFVVLLLWQAGDVKLALLTAAGFLGGFALFGLAGWLGIKSLHSLRGAFNHQGWRFAVTSLQRRPGATVIQVVSLALGLMALLLLTVVRGDLMASWRNATPPDAPNRFIINILPEQKDQIAARLVQAGVVNAPLYPMIRGRLVAVNDKTITEDTYQDDRAKGLADREFNLSTMAAMQAENKIVAGEWFSNKPGAAAEASVEEGIAKTLKLKLGDKLRFDIAGQPVEAAITSLRKLEWGSMRVNFFVIINPAAMADTPQTWITAFHLPAEHADLGNALSRDFPNLTVVDVGGILKQIQAVLDQVVTAVEFLFAFTLASGLLVLYAALMGSQDERTREAGLLRALGATRRQLAQAQLIEFSLVGALAGLLAATGAAAMGWALATYQFKFAWSFAPGVWVFGLLAGALCAIAGGWLGLRNVLKHPPLQTLRES